MPRINPYEKNEFLERNKEIVKLVKKMEDGEITEDEFQDEVKKLQEIIDKKGKTPLEEIDNENTNVEKKDNENYKEYFHKNKAVFKDILGI